MKTLSIILMILLIFGCKNQNGETSTVQFKQSNNSYTKQSKKHNNDTILAIKFAKSVYNAALNIDSVTLDNLYIKKPELHHKKEMVFRVTLNSLREFEIDKKKCLLDSITFYYRYGDNIFVNWPESLNYFKFKEHLGNNWFSFKTYFQTNNENYIMTFGGVLVEDDFYFSDMDFIYITKNYALQKNKIH